MNKKKFEISIRNSLIEWLPLDPKPSKRTKKIEISIRNSLIERLSLGPNPFKK